MLNKPNSPYPLPKYPHSTQQSKKEKKSPKNSIKIESEDSKKTLWRNLIKQALAQIGSKDEVLIDDSSHTNHYCAKKEKGAFCLSIRECKLITPNLGNMSKNYKALRDRPTYFIKSVGNSVDNLPQYDLFIQPNDGFFEMEPFYSLRV